MPEEEVTTFNHLKDIDIVLYRTKEDEDDLVSSFHTSAVSTGATLNMQKYNDEMKNSKSRKSPARFNWKLEPDDHKMPCFKPGSLRDKDWKKQDSLLASGLENSYGYAITQSTIDVIREKLKQIQDNLQEFSEFHPDHSPPEWDSDECIPAKSILRDPNETHKVKDLSKTIKFGRPVIREFSSTDGTDAIKVDQSKEGLKENKMKPPKAAPSLNSTLDSKNIKQLSFSLTDQVSNSISTNQLTKTENLSESKPNIETIPTLTFPNSSSNLNDYQTSQTNMTKNVDKVFTTDSVQLNSSTPNQGYQIADPSPRTVTTTHSAWQNHTQQPNNTFPTLNQSPRMLQEGMFQSAQGFNTTFQPNVIHINQGLYQSPSPRILEENMSQFNQGLYQSPRTMQVNMSQFNQGLYQSPRTMQANMPQFNQGLYQSPRTMQANMSQFNQGLYQSPRMMQTNMSQFNQGLYQSPRMMQTNMSQFNQGQSQNPWAFQQPVPGQHQSLQVAQQNIHQDVNTLENFPQGIAGMHIPLVETTSPQTGLPSNNTELSSDQNENVGSSNRENLENFCRPVTISNTKIDDLANKNKDDPEKPYFNARSNDWNVAIARIKYLHDYNHTLDEILDHDELFEAAEIYAMSMNQDDPADEPNENLEHNSELMTNLVFLRTIEKYQKHLSKNKIKQLAEEEEIIASGLEEILNIDVTSSKETIQMLLESHKDDINNLHSSLAASFVPDFILSNDYLAYVEQIYQSQNKGPLEIGCKVNYHNSIPSYFIF